MWQATYLFLFRALTDWVEAVGSGYKGVLDGIYMGLYQPPTTPIVPQSTMANITEANYDGYVRQLVTWFPVIQSSSGVEVVYGPNLFFAPTDATVRNTITGVFLADANYGGNLLMAAALPSPGVPLAGPGNGLVVKPSVQLPTTQIYGAPEVES
ncbi:MAG TPA: hypothetical protein VJR90_11345 [Gammaproteobacteria bacterium]|nr:hypothetical protein [Gammaproteobacteria bacterium]